MRTWRLATAVLGAWLAAATLADARRVDEERAALADLLARSGCERRSPAVAARARRDPDSVRSRVAIARALLADAAGAHHGPDPAAVDAGREAKSRRARLSLARDLAREGLRRRPASWQAALVLGGTTYVEWTMTADPRLFDRRGEWEAPLLVARALAPAERDAEELRCGALLPLWSSLGDERERLLPLQSRCFASPAFLAAALPFWLEVEPRAEVAHAVLPPVPEAWQGLADAATRRGDWEQHLLARRRAEELLLAASRGRLRRAEALLAAGAEQAAAAEMQAVVAATPPGPRAIPLLSMALSRCPAGVPPSSLQPHVRAHLDWVLERCLWGPCPLSPPALARLALWAGELPPQQRAAALVVAGERPRAEALAAALEAPFADERWADYLLLLARHSLATGDREGASRALAALAADRADGPLARALGAAASGSPVRGERTWPLGAWRWRRGVPRLEILAGEPASGLEVTNLLAPPAGAAIEVRWDGAEAARRVIRQGAILRLPVRVTPGPHLLEIVPLAGGEVQPGPARLTPVAGRS